jgi:parallel beta-helix repeat protein
MKKVCLITAVYLMVAVGYSWATIINVPGDYSTIQTAISASIEGDTVLVQPNTYFENIDFLGHNIVLGSLLLTTGDTSYISSTIIDGNQTAPVISFETDEDSTAVVSGFTIQHGANGLGSGISCTNANPTITHCLIWQNGLPNGGIGCEHASPTIKNCHITDNNSFGIYGNYSNPIIDSCVISDNWELCGGGIYCYSMCNLTVTNSVISGNQGGSGGGGIICQRNSSLDISHCVIMDNFGAPSGSGITCNNSNSSIAYCLFYGNSGMGPTGAAVCFEYCPTSILSNCTICNNSCGGISCYNSTSTILNTIVKSNGGDGGIHLENSLNAIIAFCDVFYNPSGNFTGDIPNGLGEITTINRNGDSCDVFYNIQLDPLFVSPGYDYHLQSTSPCIDAGDPASPHDPDSTIADIGAFYFHHSGDVDNIRPLQPTSFQLHQNYPNPFNPSTTITFSIPIRSEVKLSVFDIRGRKIGTLINDIRNPGDYRITFDGANLASGNYFYQLSTNKFNLTRRMILVK